MAISIRPFKGRIERSKYSGIMEFFASDIFVAWTRRLKTAKRHLICC
jgi:hypothetical protein